MCLVIVSLAIVGNIMIHRSFRTMMDREKDQCMEEIRFLHYTIATSLGTLSGAYLSTDMFVAEVGRSIQQNLNNSGNELAIYNRNGLLIYQNSSYISDLRFHMIFGEYDSQNDRKGIWRLAERDGHYYLEYM